MLVSKAEFARMHGVSHTAVAKWQKAGWLVLQGSKVDVEASNEKLKQYRDSTDGRAARSRGKVSSESKPETKDETDASARRRPTNSRRASARPSALSSTR